MYLLNLCLENNGETRTIVEKKEAQNTQARNRPLVRGILLPLLQGSLCVAPQPLPIVRV